jgi:ankyrin repeat protein
MLAALLLALVGGGVALLLVGRAWAGPSVDKKLVRQLIELSVRDQVAAALLLREHPDLLAARTIHDETLLHYCAAEGWPEGVRFLARAGIPVDATNELGDTALVDAVALGHLEVARLLLRHGANPDAVSRTRGSVLHIAVGEGNAGLAGALLDAGARADYVTSFGETVWDAIPKNGPRRDEISKVLERRGVVPAGNAP